MLDNTLLIGLFACTDYGCTGDKYPPEPNQEFELEFGEAAGCTGSCTADEYASEPK